MIIGIESPNLRSNGFSLVRAVLGDRHLEEEFPGDERSIGEVLLSPSIIYSPAVIAATATGSIGALVHVTGGGIAGNLSRVLPAGALAQIQAGSWPTPNVFRVVQRWGSVPDDEMFRVFNMGLGFLAVVSPGATEHVESVLRAHGHDSHRVGHIVEGRAGVTILPPD